VYSGLREYDRKHPDDIFIHDGVVRKVRRMGWSKESGRITPQTQMPALMRGSDAHVQFHAHVILFLQGVQMWGLRIIVMRDLSNYNDPGLHPCAWKDLVHSENQS